MGRESKEETGEPRAPLTSDLLVMGTSVQWYAEDTRNVSDFPDVPGLSVLMRKLYSYNPWRLGLGSRIEQ